MWAKWKCPVCFSFGKPPMVEQQVDVNYTPVALDLCLQNQCSFVAFFFCALPMKFLLVLASVEQLNDHLRGARRISFSFYTLTMQRQDHKCVTSAYSASLNINISHNIAIHVACSVFSSIASNLTSSVFHGFICLFSFTHKEVPENLPRSCRQACC